MLERAFGVRVIKAWSSWIVLLFLVSPPAGCDSNNVWTAWSEWSECSFTCGQGVKSRYRECVGHTDKGLVRLANPTCPGRPKEYVVCKKPPCPIGEEDEREAQCTEHNTDVILGTLYHWIPFYGGPNPCELTCLARGYSFYYNFGHVKDGTHCKKKANDLCVNGHCAKVGCDGQVGSHAVLDDCGVCGGENANCAFFQRVYNKPLPKSGDFGYNEIVRIPAGATQLKIEDSSNNYLALADARKTYIINGNWVIDWPGRYDVAGTTIYYGRSGPDNETITAEGPIKEDLFLMLIFREKNKGVKYQFWIPSDKLSQIKLNLSPASVSAPGRGSRRGQTNPTENSSHENRVTKNTKSNIYGKTYNRLNEAQKARLVQLERDRISARDGLDRGFAPGDRGRGQGNRGRTQSPPRETGGSYFKEKKHQPKGLGYHNSPEADPVNDKTRDTSRDDVSKTQAWWDALKRRDSKAGSHHQDASPRLGDGSYQQEPQPWFPGGRATETTSTDRPLSNHVIPTNGHSGTTPQPKNKRRKNQQGKKKLKKTNEIEPSKGSCGPCPKSKNRARHYCTSQFAIRMKVLKIEEIGNGNDTRYDVKIMDKYKDTISLLSREYLWVPNRCNCPRIQTNKEYIVMGSLVTDTLTKEGRLQLAENSFVRTHNRANGNRMRNLIKRVNCDKCYEMAAKSGPSLSPSA